MFPQQVTESYTSSQFTHEYSSSYFADHMNHAVPKSCADCEPQQIQNTHQTHCFKAKQKRRRRNTMALQDVHNMYANHAHNIN